VYVFQAVKYILIEVAATFVVLFSSTNQLN
jgi:hypothetical protein